MAMFSQLFLPNCIISSLSLINKSILIPKKQRLLSALNNTFVQRLLRYRPLIGGNLHNVNSFSHETLIIIKSVRATAYSTCKSTTTGSVLTAKPTHSVHAAVVGYLDWIKKPDQIIIIHFIFIYIIIVIDPYIYICLVIGKSRPDQNVDQ